MMMLYNILKLIVYHLLNNIVLDQEMIELVLENNEMNVEIDDWINRTKIMYYLLFDYHDDNDDDFFENNLK